MLTHSLLEEADRPVQFELADASIDAIPASHSIGVEARDKVGGRLVLDYLVREGDQRCVQ